MSDPLGNITELTPPAGCTTNTAKTLSGTYNPGGVVCFPNAVTISNGAILGAGLYVFQNGVTIPTGATADGERRNF